VSWSQEELVAAAYAVVFVFVLVYVAIIAAKLARLQRETAELAELARRRGAGAWVPDAASVTRAREGEVGAS
jgi:CcmD family protein